MNMADGKDMMLSDSEKGSVAKMCHNVASQNGILEKPCGIAAGIAVTGDAAAKKKSPVLPGLDEEGVCCCAVEQASCRIHCFPPTGHGILSLRRFHIT